MVDTIAARELSIYAINDHHIYEYSTRAVLRNLAKHKRKGEYNRDLAIKGMMHTVDYAAKRYASEFGGPGDKWHAMFPKDCREVTAREMLDHYSEEINELAEDQ